MKKLSCNKTRWKTVIQSSLNDIKKDQQSDSYMGISHSKMMTVEYQHTYHVQRQIFHSVKRLTICLELIHLKSDSVTTLDRTYYRNLRLLLMVSLNSLSGQLLCMHFYNTKKTMSIVNKIQENKTN